jgi:superfamily II DNA or RNA helicase
MALSAKLAGCFSRNVRKRGDDYYRFRHVRLRGGSEAHVEARVAGSLTYTVKMDYDSGILSLWCDCPYFEDNGIPCKHLWATLLAAEAAGYLTAAERAPTLKLECGDDWDDLDAEEEYDPPLRSFSPRPKSASPPPPPLWQTQLGGIFRQPQQLEAIDKPWPAKREILYVVDAQASERNSGVVLYLETRDRKKKGDWALPKRLELSRSQIAQLPLEEDRKALSMLTGGQPCSFGYYGSHDRASEFLLRSPDLTAMLMPAVIRSGRCCLRLSKAPLNLLPLAWDEAGSWSLELGIRPGKKGEGWTLEGVFKRGEERMALSAPVLVASGLVFTKELVAPLAGEACLEWISAMRTNGSITVPAEHQDDFLTTLLSTPKLPPLNLPEQLQYEEVKLQPRPQLKISKGAMRGGKERLRVELRFAYGEKTFGEKEPGRGAFDTATRRFILRDSEAERAASETLDGLGAKRGPESYWEPEPWRQLVPSKLPQLVRSLAPAGWDIEAEGKIFRSPGAFRLEVASGVDWFELHGDVEFGERVARLPELLAALRRRETMVQLDDGTYGMIPEDWLRKIAPLAGMGQPTDGHLRFHRTQAGLLDALLAAQPEARCDEAFTRTREQWRQFQGVEPAQQPHGFAGSLRHYQAEGLGWLQFLQRFSFGGCLADDMGLGKTAQVLALLETRRELRAAGQPLGPSLVVVPRSLVFNWKAEAARFTPGLRVLDHTGQARNGSNLADFDLVLTTYGTLRRDILQLKDVDFDYVVLDEAQAVKNADTESSKAVRLLRGQHRLALSGTPIENHLGELWTLFEFLNPGMLGAANAFQLTGGALRTPDEPTRLMLAQALRPFILRRTKEQVMRELPAKTEQTVYCEMEASQRKLYDELRQHYRESLLRRVESEGLAKSKIQVLEALLRLRQAACHPGLLDGKRAAGPSAKLETLLEQLREVLEEGHKALVFSQFTSLLKILRERLDEQAIAYEYLDGATRDREACVSRFQNDSGCRLFLISLKAGGLGLNLTAAEYVFILDPWWNPAVEAQAVDRAHRIGQTRPVFAYRLITRDTVEEKVLELQDTKRDLAAAIIGADNSMIRDLRSEDLALLLS